MVEQSLTIENQPQMGQIDYQGGCETGKPIILSPATFEIYASGRGDAGRHRAVYQKGQLVDTIQTVAGVATSMPLYIGKESRICGDRNDCAGGYYLGSVTRPCGDADLRPAVCRPHKMSSGAMVDVDSGAELPEEPSETDNNASRPFRTSVSP